MRNKVNFSKGLTRSPLGDGGKTATNLNAHAQSTQKDNTLRPLWLSKNYILLISAGNAIININPLAELICQSMFNSADGFVIIKFV